MNLRGSLDQVLEVSPGEEVPERDELAVGLILNIHDPPAVLASADRLAVNEDVTLGTDDSQRNHVLYGL